MHTSPDKVPQDAHMKLVDASTIQTFQAFHKELLPMIEEIITNPKNQGNASVQRTKTTLAYRIFPLTPEAGPMYPW
jgi:hypothetical protein